MKRAMLTSLFLLTFSGVLNAEVLIIANAQNPVDALERREVVDLFMGRVTAFPNGRPAQTLDYSSGTPLRETFYRALTGKSESRVDAYWATLIFAGRMSPPRQYRNEAAIIEIVANNPSAIAYVGRQPLPPSVKVLMELGDNQ